VNTTCSPVAVTVSSSPALAAPVWSPAAVVVVVPVSVDVVVVVVPVAVPVPAHVLVGPGVLVRLHQLGVVDVPDWSVEVVVVLVVVVVEVVLVLVPP
jgi:hypothetical protein